MASTSIVVEYGASLRLNNFRQSLGYSGRRVTNHIVARREFS
jgi:hypothetical protein